MNLFLRLREWFMRRFYQFMRRGAKKDLAYVENRRQINVILADMQRRETTLDAIDSALAECLILKKSIKGGSVDYDDAGGVLIANIDTIIHALSFSLGRPQ